MMYRLSEGILDRVMDGEQVETQLIFQILIVKRMKNFINFMGDTDRYRLQISDGRSLNSHVMLATPLNHLVYSNVLTENSVVCITKYAISRIQNNNGHERSVMVILDLNVVVPGFQIEKPLTITDASLIEEKLQLLDISS